jgi:hypothetical protein
VGEGLRRLTPLHVVLVVWCLVLVGLAVAGPEGSAPHRAVSVPTTGPDRAPTTSSTPAPHAQPPTAGTGAGAAEPATLPGGRERVFDGRTVVAYYGCAGDPRTGVLGTAPPDALWPRLARAAHAFDRPGRPAQPAFELVATVAGRRPGPHGDYTRDVSRATVQRYVDAAHRHGALLVLDLQPGRSDFLTVARRWAWALRDPWVGLALDPEWRVGPHGVPGDGVGAVGAAELNRTSAWLDRLTAANRLPEKVFLVHQFRTWMVAGIERVRPRPHLALVQHMDGFGTPQEKRATYHAIARPDLFHEGFKLFYEWDRPRMWAAAVAALEPPVEFVSFQ